LIQMIKELQGLVKQQFVANLSSALCQGCGSPNSPTLIDGRYSEGYAILDERGINYPWHRECAAKALAQVKALTEQVQRLSEERDRMLMGSRCGTCSNAAQMLLTTCNHRLNPVA
jgi:bacterioferritin-associated ferredoxin